MLTVKKLDRYDFLVATDKVTCGKEAPMNRDKDWDSCKRDYKGVYGMADIQNKSGRLTNGETNESERVPLSSLSELTGFPVDFIKKELILNDEDLSMEDLRQSMLSYLERSAEEITQ